VGKETVKGRKRNGTESRFRPSGREGKKNKTKRNENNGKHIDQNKKGVGLKYTISGT